MTNDELIAEIDKRIEDDDMNLSDDFKYLPLTVAEYKRLRGSGEAPPSEGLTHGSRVRAGVPESG